MSADAHHSALQNVLRDHVCGTWVDGDGVQRAYCDACLEPWPCDARVLAEEERTKLRVRADEAQAWADAYHRERARIALLEGLLREAVVFVEEAQIGSPSPADLRLLRRINATLAVPGATRDVPHIPYAERWEPLEGVPGGWVRKDDAARAADGGEAS